MPREQSRQCVGMFLREFATAFDVCEKESDSAGWEIHDPFSSNANSMISSIVIPRPSAESFSNSVSFNVE